MSLPTLRREVLLIIQINSAPELILTELILENVLADYTPQEAVALLSIFVFVEKTESQPHIAPKLQQGLEVIYRIADEVEREQDRNTVAYDEFKEKYKVGLVEVVYEWARGMVRSLPCSVLVYYKMNTDD
jgi:antiviral helicase SKI2